MLANDLAKLIIKYGGTPYICPTIEVLPLRNEQEILYNRFLGEKLKVKILSI